MSAGTFYAEATIAATGQLMADSGLSVAQIERLRQAEARGTITGLTVSADIDVIAAFRQAVQL